jgi:RNA recognition motif-containing protein
VASAEVMFNRETNKSRGFGFVVFENESSVDRVLQAAGTRQHCIDGKAVSFSSMQQEAALLPSTLSPLSHTFIFVDR